MSWNCLFRLPVWIVRTGFGDRSGTITMAKWHIFSFKPFKPFN